MLSNNGQATVKRRSKGEKTKYLILKSAIVMLAQHGIKGTTHRAIAAHANIQLSLTTYYFKDIQELIQQAFELNSDKTINALEPLWQPVLNLLDTQSKTALRKVSVRVELRDALTDLLLALIASECNNNRQQLIVEQQLLSEIQVSPALTAIAEHNYNAQLQPCQQICQLFTREEDSANIKAQLLYTIIKQCQYRQLFANASSTNYDNIRQLLHQTLALVLAIRP
ncbi:MAG: TetR/AcrR family transcriptional regulator [Cognaticolwellia sp.]